MDKMKSGWFSELSPVWPGQCFSLEVEKILFHERSKYQDVLVFKSKNYGNVLVLDDVIECTERDEFAYQEMCAHLPMFSHPNPEKILIVGGGDGGVIRECLKHPMVKSITLCEIDKVVIEACQKYLPSMSNHMDDPRVTRYVGDGFSFMENHQNEFDIIITDSSDPDGPAHVLFEKPYYELLHQALKEDGVVCSQGGSIWLQLELIQRMNRFCRTLFPVVSYSSFMVPGFTSGQLGLTLCHKNKNLSFSDPCRKITEEEQVSMKLRYYNLEVHKASFVLPQFAKEAIEYDLPIEDEYLKDKS